MVERYRGMDDGHSPLQDRGTWSGLTQEAEVLGLFGVMLLSKLCRCSTVDEMLGKLFFYGKVTVLCLLWKLDRYVGGE